MPIPPEPAPDLSYARHAHGAAQWRLSADGQQIELKSLGPAISHNLLGAWSIEEFGRAFDGLHRAELLQSLQATATQPDIDITVELAQGGPAHFRGKVCDDGSRQGLVLLPTPLTTQPTDAVLEAAFQPIVRLSDRTIAGYECLARLRGPDGAFVPVEAAHPVLALGPAMTRKAIAYLTAPANADHFINLNLSACEVGEQESVKAIASLLQSAELAPGRLRIELTEQAAVRDWAEVRSGISRLRQAGAGIVLDDFGAGHSSMLWLSELEVDGVKLDASFLGHLSTSRGRLILQRLLGLLSELAIESVIEGVEDEAILPVLLELGGTLGQGFALGSPAPPPHIDAPRSAE